MLYNFISFYMKIWIHFFCDNKLLSLLWIERCGWCGTTHVHSIDCLPRMKILPGYEVSDITGFFFALETLYIFMVEKCKIVVD